MGTFIDSTGALRGYLRNLDGSFTAIDDPKAATGVGLGTAPDFINASGVIAGFYSDAAGAEHGFIRK